MNEYRVKWEIDLEAENPTIAAIKARSIQLDPDSIATVFEVCKVCEISGVNQSTYSTVDIGQISYKVGKFYPLLDKHGTIVSYIKCVQDNPTLFTVGMQNRRTLVQLERCGYTVVGTGGEKL